MPQGPDSDFITGLRPPDLTLDEPRPEGDSRPQLSIGFILMPKFTLMALAGFVEALRHAADISDRSRQIDCAWSIIGANHTPVESSCGISVTPWKTFRDIASFDYLAVVGGLLSGHENDPQLTRYIKAAAERGVTLIGLCTGSFALVRAGLLDGRRCCVSYYHVAEFQKEFAARNIEVAADTLFTWSGSHITCAGGLGAVDLAIHLLERHLGSHRAHKSAAQMIFSGVRPAAAPQPRFSTAWYSSVRDPTVQRATSLMELHFSAPISIDAISRRLCISVKQLERAFARELAMTPAFFYRKIRLDTARCLLAETARPITSVALDCGFSDASHFGRVFRSTFGLSPRHYRQAHEALHSLPVSEPFHRLSNATEPPDR